MPDCDCRSCRRRRLIAADAQQAEIIFSRAYDAVKAAKAISYVTLAVRLDVD
jgi:hypothetical protein